MLYCIMVVSVCVMLFHGCIAFVSVSHVYIMAVSVCPVNCITVVSECVYVHQQYINICYGVQGSDAGGLSTDTLRAQRGWNNVELRKFQGFAGVC